MDPATVVGLIGSVIQIVEFTTDVVRESHRLVRSGKKPSVVELSEVVKCQEHACKQVLAEITLREAADTAVALEELEQGCHENRSLVVLARSCVEEASRLTQTLNKLAVKPRGDGTTSLGAALWSVTRARLKKKDIEDSQRKLQADISNLLLQLIRDEQRQGALDVKTSILKSNEGQYQAFENAIQNVHSKLEAIGTTFSVEQKTFFTELQSKIREQHGALTGAIESDNVGAGIRSSDNLLSRHNFNQPDATNSRVTDYEAIKEQLGSSERIQEVRVGYEEQQKAKREKKAIDRILQSLDFQERTQRQAAIQDAHHATFEWMFREGSSPIQNWAESDRGIFWVNGKAGSGKSTLMKYVSNHGKAKDLLRTWAAKDVPGHSSHDLNTTLTIVQIYFWYLGTDLQRSEEGLLRSMLFQILRVSRDMIPIAAARRWESVRVAINSIDPWEVEMHLNAAGLPWTLTELRTSLEKVAECTSDHRFAFFVDGLDEYKADHHGLAQLLQSMARNPNFKFCVSSRPWNAFVNAFGSQEDVFVLEYLTRSDIRNYVYSKLTKNISNQPQLEALCSDVIAKAQGVFLWVTLTVRSLLEGLEENDNVRILRRRVDELPSDLGEYFDVILSRVHTVYRDQTATALFMAHRAVQRELLHSKSWKLPPGHHRSFVNLWFLQQGFEAEDFALGRAHTEVTALQCHDMVRQTKRFISACCKDLLCVPKPPPAGRDGTQTYVTQYTFEFLHRTVYEYLDTASVMARLQRSVIPHVRKTDFDTMLAIARLSCLAIHSNGRCRFLDETLEAFLSSAPHHELDQAVYGQLDSLAARYVEHCLCNLHDSAAIHHLLVSRRHYKFTTAIMRKTDSVALKDGSVNQHPLLYSALGISRKCRLFPIDEIDFPFVDAYLASAVGINFIDDLDNLSVWDRLFADWHAATQNGQVRDAALVWNVVKRFIEAGADISKRARGIRGEPSSIKTLTALIPTGHQHELYDLIAAGRSTGSSKPSDMSETRASTEVHPVSPNVDRYPDETLLRRKSVVFVKPPAEQTEEEIEAYYQRTGFRP